MLKKINKFMISSIIFSIVLLILGITLIIMPLAYLTIMSTVVAVSLLTYGIMLIILNYKLVIPYIDNITSGILIIILGIILLIYPQIISAIFPICLGIWFILNSISKIRISLLLKEDNRKWIITLILSILSIICGMILIINPFSSAITLTKILGVILVIYSISDMIDMIIFKKNINNIVKYLKKAFKEIN